MTISMTYLLRIALLSLVLITTVSCASHSIKFEQKDKAPDGSFSETSASTSSQQLATRSVKLPATFTIYIAELLASEDAARELFKFRTGEHDDEPSIYQKDSAGVKELLAGSYYQALSQFLIQQMADWYGGQIPDNNGLFTQSDAFRPFSPNDAFWEFFDGIDMADVIGSITHKVRMATKDGNIYFMATNDMSLESYAGENYLRHGLINNPEVGKFRSTTQVFTWQLPIPESYRADVKDSVDD